MSVQQVVDLHSRVLAQSGGLAGIRDMAAVDSAVAQPRMTFGGQELYPTIAEKAAALGYSLICNHRLLTATNASAMQQWKRFSSRMDTSWLRSWTSKSE